MHVRLWAWDLVTKPKQKVSQTEDNDENTATISAYTRSADSSDSVRVKGKTVEKPHPWCSITNVNEYCD